jgi:hypothetical protein
MSTPGTAPKKVVKAPSVRRYVNRRILRFSLLIGTAVTLLIIISFFASVYPTIQKVQEINQRTISEINCTEKGCDTSALATDWALSDADYIIDTQTRSLLAVPGSEIENAQQYQPLDYSDTEFIARFRQPTTYPAPNSEVWRLYSRPVEVNKENLEVIVGYAEKASWKMIDSPKSLLGSVDVKLKSEAETIVASLKAGKRDFRGVRADGFEIVNAKTQQVLNWGPWLPMYLPKATKLPEPGRQLHLSDSDIYIVQTDTDGRLCAVSLVSVGEFRWLALLTVFVFLCATLGVYFLSHRFLRGYFALRRTKIPSIKEALEKGEGEEIEFKRGISDSKLSKGDDEILESIASFANTNGGVIFIGIDDEGHIKGLAFNSKQRDLLEQKLRQLAHNRINPMPPMQIVFEEIRELTVAKIIVARGDAPIYMLDGRIYVRSGSLDMPAEPDDVLRLLAS